MKIIFLGCGYLGHNLSRYFTDWQLKVWGLDSPYSFIDEFEAVDVFALKPSQLADIHDAVVVDTLSLFPFNFQTDDEPLFLNNFVNRYQRLYADFMHAGIRQYIYLSSGGTVYGNCTIPCREDFPLNGYGLNVYSTSKVILEKVIAQSGMPYTILRLSNPYGGYQLTNRKQGVIPVLIESALFQKTFQCWNTLESKRDYIYIADVAKAMRLIIEHHLVDDIYNVGEGRSSTLGTIIDMVQTITHQTIPMEINIQNEGIVTDSLLDITKLHQACGFVADIDLFTGIGYEVERIKKENKR